MLFIIFTYGNVRPSILQMDGLDRETNVKGFCLPAAGISQGHQAEREHIDHGRRWCHLY